MQGNLFNNKEFGLHAFVFIACAIATIVTNNWLLLSIPFAALAIPIIFKQSIFLTENLFWLLIFCLPLSTEVNITPSLGLDFPDEMLMMLLTGLFFVKLLYKPTIFPFHLLKHPLFLLIVLQLLWAIISTIFSENPLLSIKFVLAKVWFIVPFVVLFQIIVTQFSLLKKIALLLLLPMAFVVVQCLFRHSLFHFSFEGIKQTLSPFFRNHVNYSAMLVCLIAVVWFVKALTPYNKKTIRWMNLGIIVGLVALFFAYSRGAWIALFAGIGIVYIIKKKRIKQSIAIALSCLLLGISYLVYDNQYLKFAPDYEHTIFHADLGDHLQSTTSLKDLSNAERFYRWVAGAKMFAEKPITGFGPNTFYSYYKNYTSNLFRTYVSDNPEHSSVHNYFLLTALEQGAIGVLLFISFLCLLFIRLQYIYHHLLSNEYKNISLLTAVILVMIVTVNFMSDMIETDKIGSLFWLCVGTTIFLDNQLKTEKESIA